MAGDRTTIRLLATSRTPHLLPLWIVAVGVLVAGCPSGSRPQSMATGFRQGGGSSSRSEWSIRCIELFGGQAKRQSEQLADALRRTSGIRDRDVFVRHDLDGYSRVYYGTYRRPTDPRTGRPTFSEKMKRDLALVQHLGDEYKRMYFPRAKFVPTPPPDVGNPAWALSRADGAYSLQVASFVPTGDFREFKEAAAEYCAYLREQGHEAYFHHAPSSSIVTVGTFGEDAVEVRRVRRPTNKPGQFAVVEETHYSEEILALQRNELFKYNYVNGGLSRERQGRRLGPPAPSQLVPIPRPGAEVIPLR